MSSRPDYASLLKSHNSLQKQWKVKAKPEPIKEAEEETTTTKNACETCRVKEEEAKFLEMRIEDLLSVIETTNKKALGLQHGGG